ncbi:hypothetical protein AYO49_06530 [Verrucomicrobiaceae bacterium SCGC AG-212-N21]|nr:hypothetical protein AYO49_06530 [Verrucomicrobiaceae bacterium SCGC AG-212-N21]
MEVRANGRPLAVEVPVPRGDEDVRISVPIPAWFEGEVSVIASHALASSEAATLRVRRDSLPPPPKPKLFVISIGAAQLAMNQSALLAASPSSPLQTKDRFQDLEFAAQDAQKVVSMLAAQRGKAFSEVQETVLLNEKATTAALRQAVQGVAAKAELGDVLLFFFSGHGNHDPKTGKFHLVTHDTDPKREAETAFSGEELSQLLGQVRGYVVVALDACHSGAVLGMQQGEKYKAPPLDISGLANQLSSAEHGIVMLSSSTPDEVSFEDRELGSGLFTKALLEGLEGKAAKDGTVTFRGLLDWLGTRVTELASDGQPPADGATSPAQTPVTVMPAGVPDFVIARP